MDDIRQTVYKEAYRRATDQCADPAVIARVELKAYDNEFSNSEPECKHTFKEDRSSLNVCSKCGIEKTSSEIFSQAKFLTTKEDAQYFCTDLKCPNREINSHGKS